MMINIEQLANSASALPSQPNFMRHVMVGLLPIILSFIIMQMEKQYNDSTSSFTGNDANSGILRYIARWFFQSTIIAAASWVVSIWSFILRIAGTTLGVGLGLGLAGHIYDSLDDMSKRHLNKDDDVNQRKRSSSITAKIPASPYASSQDPNSYHSLMKSAGYHVENVTLRAQMVRGDLADMATRANGTRAELYSARHEPQQRPSIYKFDQGGTAFSRMKSMWPNLNPVINESLAKLTEFVLRDYVASWYGKVDENVPCAQPPPTEINDHDTNQSVYAAASMLSKGSSPNQMKTDTSTGERQERRATLAAPFEVSSSLNSTASTSSMTSNGRPPASSQLSKSMPTESNKSQQQTQNRTMVLSTTGTLPSPFIESLYTSFAYLFGTLATRASNNVNVLELLLLHLPHVLGKNLKVYRELKNAALDKKRRRTGANTGTTRPGSRRVKDTRTQKQSTSTASAKGSSSSTSRQSLNEEDNVSEIAVIREYLLAGRLHRALTFGLDVPSLLFADPLAKDCPCSVSYKEIQERLEHEEDSVLEDRLLSLNSTLVAECELDYNRVLASKVAKLVVPKSEIESTVVRTFLVEMLASCVLQPLMGCFIPNSVNGWIITGMQLLLEEGEVDNTTPETGATSASVARSESEGSLDGTNRSLFSFSDSNHNVNSHDDDMDAVLENALGDTVSDILGEESVTSELDETVFDADDASRMEDRTEKLPTCAKSEQLITLLSMSIIELRNFVDFDDCRYAKEHNQDIPINWDNDRAREAIRHLVLVIEAALLLGARPERKRETSINHLSEMVETTLEEEDPADGDDFEVDIDVVSEVIVPSSSFQHHNSISSVLMELTGDLDEYEKMILTENQNGIAGDDDSVQDPDAICTPKPSELSTLRTLIAAWLHTGQAFRVLSIIAKSHEQLLRPFYYADSFTRRENYMGEFTKLLKQLDSIEILVDTTAVLASRCLLVTGGGLDKFERQLLNTIDSGGINKQPEASAVNADNVGSGILKMGSVRSNFVQNRDRLTRFAQTATESFNFGKADYIEDHAQNAYKYHQHSQGTPVYLQFNKNHELASSLRAERQRRMESWHKETSGREKLDMVCRSKGANEKDTLLQRELHHLARFFYSNTNEIMIDPCSGDASIVAGSAANVTVKSIAPRRKIEVPDEDSSFLLRAQPRTLKPVAIHRDQQHANLACKIYVAMYEEPAIHPRTKRFYGGKNLRQCLLKYYPNDKTASVSIANDLTVLDRRVGQPRVDHILTKEFQGLRHNCLKVAPSASLLTSPLMEPNDFNATPRSGKAVDFIHRISFFDRPIVELGGKKFVVHDASALLHHRANASSLELSDAALTAAIILRGSSGLNACHNTDDNSRLFSIKISNDGSPLVLLRANAPGKEQGAKEEARPYRPSFLRAALLVQSARQDAQNQCLLHCIKNGSVRSQKIKSDNWLQPTLHLLHFANSRRKEEQFLLRDLQLGMYHIDRAQLCRNGLLNPRYPTVLRGLTVKVVGAIEMKPPLSVDLLVSPTLTLFKIHCTAITEYVGEDEDVSKSKSRYFREEWTVSRSLRDFAVFHKHIKSQVAPTEHSASTGAKLVGAATALSSIVGVGQAVNKKERGPLVPSLSKATQVGTLGLSSKRVMEKRKKLLDEYLKYLTAPSNLLSRSPELLKFLGAYTCIFSSTDDCSEDDAFGREDASRVELDTDKLKAGIVHPKPQTEERRPNATPKQFNKPSTTTVRPRVDEDSPVEIFDASHEPAGSLPTDNSKVADKQQPNLTRRMAMIRSQEVNLRDVRRSAFRLLSDIFDLDSASFFRSRVISVIKTMSLAFTNVQDFQLTLFKMHVKYMNGEWVSGWIFYLINMFWPDGVFYTKGPDLTEQEQIELKVESKKILERALPLQLKTVLGRHSDDGLDLLHEMLQNRLVLKSIAYMLIDIVFAEVFPELIDFATGADCLEKEL